MSATKNCCSNDDCEAGHGCEEQTDYDYDDEGNEIEDSEYTYYDCVQLACPGTCNCEYPDARLCNLWRRRVRATSSSCSSGDEYYCGRWGCPRRVINGTKCPSGKNCNGSRCVSTTTSPPPSTNPTPDPEPLQILVNLGQIQATGIVITIAIVKKAEAATAGGVMDQSLLKPVQTVYAATGMSGALGVKHD